MRSSTLTGQFVPGGRLTYEGQPTRSNTAILKTLVIITIAWFAYWAATGGLDQIAVPPSPTITTTTVAQ